MIHSAFVWSFILALQTQLRKKVGDIFIIPSLFATIAWGCCDHFIRHDRYEE